MADDAQQEPGESPAKQVAPSTLPAPVEESAVPVSDPPSAEAPPAQAPPDDVAEVVTPSPAEDTAETPEESFGFLFSTRGATPARPIKSTLTPPAGDTPTSSIPSDPNFHGQRPKQRKPIGDGKKGGGGKKASARNATPRKKEASSSSSSPGGAESPDTQEYGPAVSRRAGASSLLMQASIGAEDVAAVAAASDDGEAAAALASIDETAETAGGAVAPTPTATEDAPPMTDAPPMPATEPSAQGPSPTHPPVAAASQPAETKQSPPKEKKSKGAVPKKWQSLEAPDADFRKSAALVDSPDEKPGKGKKEKRKSGFFGKKSAVEKQKFVPKTALAYYGTIGGGFGTPRGGSSVALGQFNVPAWLAIRPTGELIVSSVFNHEVQICTPRGGPAQILTRGFNNWRLFNPQGIAINAEGNVMWVSNGGWDRVERYSLTVENGTTTIEAEAASESKACSMPQGLVVEQNILFVASSNSNQIVVLDAHKLNVLFSFGSRAEDGSPLLQKPTDLAIYHNKDMSNPKFGRTVSALYVADSANHRIAVFSTDGDLIFTFGSLGSDPGKFHEPLGICVRDEKVFVCEGIGARLQVLNPEGEPLLLLPSPTAGRLVGCAWHESRLYVSEIEAHRLHVFRIVD